MLECPECGNTKNFILDAEASIDCKVTYNQDINDYVDVDAAIFSIYDVYSVEIEKLPKSLVTCDECGCEASYEDFYVDDKE